MPAQAFRALVSVMRSCNSPSKHLCEPKAFVALIAAVSYIFVAMAMAINSPLMDFIDERVLEYDWMFAIFVLAVFLLISYMVGSGASAPLASTEGLAIYVLPRKVGEVGH